MANIPGILGYAKPGAYSTVRTRPGTIALPGGARILALIGLGGREEILISRAAGGELTATVGVKPIVAGMEAVFINGVEKQISVDYTIDETTGVITLLAALVAGDQLSVKYVAVGDYNSPELFFDPSDLFAKHGYPSATNTLALGAQIAFENGAPAVLAVQADPSDTGFANSYEALEKESCQFVCPLPVRYFLDVFNNGKSHVENMSTTKNRKERMLLIGGVNGLEFDDVIATVSPTPYGPSWAEEQDDFINDIFIGNYVGHVVQTAPTYGPAGDAWGVPYNYGDSFRVVYFFPDRVLRVIDSVTTIINGFYMAAAAGGYLANQGAIAMPLTRKSLNGFTIESSRKFTETQMDMLASAGIAVIEALGAGGRIRHGLTTTQSGIPEQQEVSIIQISDYVASVTRTTLENIYVGGVIDNTTVPSMSSTLEAVLSTLASQNIITAFANASVKQDRTEPRQMDVQFDVQPVYPLNWIRIDFSIGLL